MEMNSIHNAKEDENDNLIPRYKVLKFNFSDEEKFILEELRENLIDLAISEKMSSFNEELILKDIIRFLENMIRRTRRCPLTVSDWRTLRRPSWRACAVRMSR